MWGEHTASRWSQEIASCLLYHIRNCLPPTTKEVILYSDSCGGQNRNIKMTLMLSYIVQKTEIQEIQQKFFLPGHSFSTCDQDFGIIEREKKYHPYIFLPDDWCTVVENAKKKQPKFVIHKMTSDLFFSSKSLEVNITNRKVNVKNDKVEWLKVPRLKVQREHPKLLFYTYNCLEDDVFCALDIAKKSRRGRHIRLFPDTLEPLYPEGRKISKDKVKDLKSLLKFEPPQLHQFYMSLHGEEEGIPAQSNSDEDSVA